MTDKKRIVLPFTAIVGQEKLKEALILNAINPNLHGVLIKGEKGTAKSTAVRALADLLPEIEVVKGCPFNCSPTDPSLQCDECKKRYLSGEKLPVERRKMRIVDLPLGATEDRVVGTIDIEKALKEGVKALQPGILAEVNQGILYIDEVNLLDDHLVDLLLDAAAMGINIIERESISISHPSRFILVGTMNPEEGELRPQFLDRFGLQVEIEKISDPKERIKIVKTVEEFENNPEEFIKKYEDKQNEVRKRIEYAKSILKDVTISEELLEKISKLCIEVGVDGHRADILMTRTAKTIAAYNGRKEVNIEDVKKAAELVLPHRTRRTPFQEQQPIENKIEQVLNANNKKDNKQEEENKENKQQQDEKKTQQEEQQQPQQENKSIEQQKPQKQKSGEQQENKKNEIQSQDKDNDNEVGTRTKTFGLGESKKPDIKIEKDKKLRIGSGRRTTTLSSKSGRYIKAKIPKEKPTDIAVDATIRASIMRGGKGKIKDEDLREKIREKKKASVIVFVVDASGSMAAKNRMAAAKGSVMALLQEAYQKRDKIGFVAFKGNKADVLLSPTSSVTLASKILKDLPTGGRTPLSDGLYKGLELLKKEMNKDKNIIPLMVLVSDGRGNVPIRKNGSVRQEIISIANEIKEKKINLIVIDSESEKGIMRMG